MSIDLSQFVQVFFEETAEHLANMESLLLQLDVASPDAEDLNAIFRAAHSIKGGAATFGFTDLTDVTHILENQLDRVRKGALQLRPDMVDTFLEAGDTLANMLHAHQSGGEADAQLAGIVCAKLQALEISPTLEAAAVVLTIDKSKVAEEQLDVARRNLLDSGWSSISAHEFQWQLSLPPILDGLEFLLPAGAYRLGNQSDASADVVSIVSDETDEDSGFGFFELLPEAATDDGYGFFEPITEHKDVAPMAVEGEGYGLFIPVDPVAQLVVSEPLPATEAAKAPIKRAPVERAKDSQHSDSTSIRVSVDKVDQIINMVGELVITQAMLAQVVGQLDNAQFESLHAGIAMLERNTRELQESAMSIRMMPISSVFSRFPRVVRDTANKLGKKVRLLTFGENTELDRGLIERLADPLTHLVRNSLDHGIESPEVRQSKGKDEQGTLTLKAFHQGGNIIIQVIDDGGGLNRERILAKAKSQGMAVSDSMTDSEVWPLIFEAGFSTAEVVTDVSGRGVGMDVVRKNIQGMGGRIDIDSIRDAGTTMTIRLPLTLAILDGMAINVGGDIFVVPLAFIVESLQPNPGDIKKISGKGLVLYVRGEYLPIITLNEALTQRRIGVEVERGLFVILESELGKTALLVDDLLGQSQVVIKSLETNYKKVPGISGATIMGDGRVALIIDVESLVRLSQKKLPENI